MKLLVVSNVFDEQSDLMGVVPSWVRALANHLNEVVVITQHRGMAEIPSNVTIHRIDKEKNPSKIVRLFLFWQLLWRQRHHYDAVLVLMAPGWVMMAWPLTMILQKRLALWYAVWRGTWKVRCAQLLADYVFTSVPEAFPFAGRNVMVVGQGIDTERFFEESSQRVVGRIIFMGRISPVKKIDVLIRALALLAPADENIHLQIIGEPRTSDDVKYKESLQALSEGLGVAQRVSWLGFMPHTQVAQAYRTADIFVNLTPTGSFDKAALEAMASGTLTITSNRSLANLLGKANLDWAALTTASPEAVAEALRHARSLSKSEGDVVRKSVHSLVANYHSVQQWAKNIIRQLA